MRKPQDPRHHGLKEPKLINSKFEHIRIVSQGLGGKVPLATVIATWNNTLKDHESQGHRITEAPHFTFDSLYGSTLTINYTYEWDNHNYDSEKAVYDIAVGKYLDDLKAFEEKEKRNREGPPAGIDEKIDRAEKRLANLKAIKAGQPLPYPEG